MLKIRANRKETLKTLQFVNKAVPTKTTLDILSCILLEAKNNELKVTATNLDFTIEAYIEVDVEEEGTIAISAKEFIEFINKVYSERITIEEKENNIELYYDMSVAKFNKMNTDEYPVIPTFENDYEINLNANGIKEMIRKTIKSCSNDNIRPILTGILFDISENKLTLVGLDGYRMMVTSSDVKNANPNKVIIPADALQNIVKLNIEDEKDDINIKYNKAHIEFKYNNIKLQSRLLEGQYIEYNNIIPKTNEDIILRFAPLILKDAIGRADILSGDNGKMIELQLKENKVIIKGQSKQGSIVEELIMDTRGEIIIALNSKYLADALESFSKDSTMYFINDTSPVVIKEDSNTTALILPIRRAKAG